MSVSRLFHRNTTGEDEEENSNDDHGRPPLPNILFIITDQERAVQHYFDDDDGTASSSFSQTYLPNLERLKLHGIDFQQHYTNTCMCSPSRATLLTSQFPATTGVTKTGSPGPPQALPPHLPNLATVLKNSAGGAGGYKHVQWYGKWHVGQTPQAYGFDGWVPPDAGNYLSLNETLGGGTPDNDGRFLTEIVDFLKQYRRRDDRQQQQQQSSATLGLAEPFCVVASFVNPHDVYVAQHELPAMGYTPRDFHRIQVPLPTNATEDTDASGKPRAQGRMSMRHVRFENTPQDYVNFYAYLQHMVDAQIGTILDTLEDLELTKSTLIIRTADHGEQALSHSLVEKFFNCYEESIHIPLIISNPIAFPQPQTTQVLTSHIDILPTLAKLVSLSVPNDGKAETQQQLMMMNGKDLTPILDDPKQTAAIITNDDSSEEQEHIHFTYDDIACPGAPSIIRCIRTPFYKYAVYFEEDGSDADWELYDLQTDPLEDHNVAGNTKYAAIQQQLDEALQKTMAEMGTLPKEFQWPPTATPMSRGVACCD